MFLVLSSSVPKKTLNVLLENSQRFLFLVDLFSSERFVLSICSHSSSNFERLFFRTAKPKRALAQPQFLVRLVWLWQDKASMLSLPRVPPHTTMEVVVVEERTQVTSYMSAT